MITAALALSLLVPLAPTPAPPPGPVLSSGQTVLLPNYAPGHTPVRCVPADSACWRDDAADPTPS